jgi:hypothetical protein
VRCKGDEEAGEKQKKEIFEKFCRSPQANVDDKMIRQFHKALEAIFDSPFAQPFQDRQLLKYLTTPDDFAESTGTNTQYSDFCNLFVCKTEKLVTFN